MREFRFFAQRLPNCKFLKMQQLPTFEFWKLLHSCAFCAQSKLQVFERKLEANVNGSSFQPYHSPARPLFYCLSARRSSSVSHAKSSFSMPESLPFTSHKMRKTFSVPLGRIQVKAIGILSLSKKRIFNPPFALFQF